MTSRNIAFAVFVGLMLAAQGAIAGPANADQSGPGWGPGMMMGNGWGGRGWGMMSGQGGGPGRMMGGGCGMMGIPNSGSNFETYTDGRIAFLQAELKITDAQKTAWNEYADALRSNSEVMVSMHQKMRAAFQQKDGDRTSPQWLDFHIQMMKSGLVALEALKPATEALYKALSPEQRQSADRLLPAMGCM